MAFTDIMGDYLQRRMDTAVQPFTDPEAYLRQRLLDDEEERRRREREEAERLQAEQQAAQQRAAEQAQQVQERVQQSEPAPTEMAGMPQTAEMPGATPVTGPVQPQPVAPVMGGPAPVVQDQANIEEQRRIEQAQAAQATQPAVPVAPVAPAQPQPQMAQQPQMAPQPVPQVQLPQPGPSVQVAGPAVAPPEPGVGVLRPPAGMVAPAPQPQPQLSFAERIAQAGQKLAGAAPAAAETAAPDYSADLGGIASDPAKLAAFYADTNNPEPARKIAAQLWRSHLEGTSSQDRAEKTLVAAAQGDPRAQSEVMRDLKRDEGSYVKAVLFARLGLNKLAEQEQEKLGQTGRTVSRALLGTEGYTVEQDSRGAIVRAWDSEGNRVGDRTLAQLNASGQKAGGQIYSATATSMVIPAGQTNAGEEYRQIFDSTSGKFKNVITTGPNAGQEYRGPAGIERRVGTQAQIDYNRKMIDFNTNPNIAAATDAMKFAIDAYGVNSPEVQRTQQAIQNKLGPQALNQIIRSVPAAAGAPVGQAPAAAGAPVVQQAPAVGGQAPVGQAPVGQAPAVGGAPVVGAPAVGAPAVGAPAVGGTSPARFRQGLEIGTAAAKENIQVQGARSQSFNKILDEEVRPQAQAGDTVSSARKQQFAIFDRPGIDANKLFGLYTAAQESPNDQKLSIIRDIFGGVFKPEAEVSQRLAQLNLTPAEKAALQEYNIANQKINAATLKQTAGPGAVSDAEQRANRESNVDITKIPALGAYNAMAQSQFDGDRARWKADWALTQPAQNALELDRAWRKESQRLSNIYRDMATQRIRFINENGNTFNAVREGYRRFPVPEYDPESGTWKKTKPLGAILGGQ